MTPTSIERLRAVLEHAAAAYGPPKHADWSDDPWAGVVAQIRRGPEQMIGGRRPCPPNVQMSPASSL
jgi:hypothetical protein